MFETYVEILLALLEETNRIVLPVQGSVPSRLGCTPPWAAVEVQPVPAWTYAPQFPVSHLTVEGSVMMSESRS
mgnify:FL=1